MARSQHFVHSFLAGSRNAPILVLLALLPMGCTRQSPVATPDYNAPLAAGQKPDLGDWVVQETPGDPDTLNPPIAQDDTSQSICDKVFDTLLYQNRTTLKLEPNMAESYEISPNQMVYTFHLRHGIRWHDGQPFTADDVKFTFDTIQDPTVDAAPVRPYFANIKSCEVLDPYTVRFTATERYFKTLEVLGTNFMEILPKHCFSGNGGDFNRSHFGRAPIGCGPYKFVRWDTGSQLVLERNDDYWKGPGHYPKRLVYQIIQEPSVSVQLLKKGELDVLDYVPAIQWVRELEHSHSMVRLRELTYSFPAYTYLGFNLRNPLFADVRVRHAIDLLIPRSAILSQIYLGKFATECSGYDPPASPSYNHALPPTPEDPALARQLLAQAGWKNDHGDGILYKDGKPLSFTVVYRSGSPASEKSVELMQESFHQAGVDIKLDRLEFVQLIDKTEDWKFDACLLSWALDLNGDPFQIWDGSQANMKRSSNFIGYNSPVADKLIAAGRVEYDDAKRNAIFQHLQQVIHDDYPVCFLFNPVAIIVVSKRFQGVTFFAPRPCFDPTEWWVPRPLQKYQ